jgi:hypothetical protein
MAQLTRVQLRPAAPAPQLDPQAVFQSACDRLRELESKYPALGGLSKVKPSVKLSDDKRFESASFTFQQNAAPPGKDPAKALDASKPFLFISVQVWTGHSLQPPAGIHGFQWKDEDYEAWVQVYASDPLIVTAVRKTVAEPILAPPARDR